MARTPEQAARLLVAHPCRLDNGVWGAWVRGDAEVGKIVKIEARSGRAWESRISAILWSGHCERTGLPLHKCATTSLDGKGAPG